MELFLVKLTTDAMMDDKPIPEHEMVLTAASLDDAEKKARAFLTRKAIGPPV